MTSRVGSNSQRCQSPSPPTDRVVAVMNLLGDEPERRMTVSEIGRELGISRATAHAILAALGSHDWVVRDPMSGDFSWGPAIQSLASRPSDARRRLLRARLAELSVELGMPVLLFHRNGMDLTAIEAAGESPPTPPVGVGFHVPFLAPFGREFAAFLDDSAQRAWLDRLNASTAEIRSRLYEVLADIRGRGFAVERLSRELSRVNTALQALAGSGDIDVVINRLAAVVAEGTIVDFRDDELGEDEEHEIAMVMAPMSGPDGLANYAISAIPLASLKNLQLEQLGHRMRDAALTFERLLARGGTADGPAANHLALPM